MIEHMNPWIPLLAEVIIVGFGGQTVKRMVFGPGLGKNKERLNKLKLVIAATLPWQALIAGLSLSLLAHRFGLPNHPAFGEEIGGAAIQGLCAGVLSVAFYELIVSTLKEFITAKQRQLRDGDE